jgi:hypothetical protein
LQREKAAACGGEQEDEEMQEAEEEEEERKGAGEPEQQEQQRRRGLGSEAARRLSGLRREAPAPRLRGRPPGSGVRPAGGVGGGRAGGLTAAPGVAGPIPHSGRQRAEFRAAR